MAIMDSVRFTRTLVNSFSNLLTELPNAIAAWDNDAFTKVRNWVDDTGESIVKFFSGHFSVA